MAAGRQPLSSCLAPFGPSNFPSAEERGKQSEALEQEPARWQGAVSLGWHCQLPSLQGDNCSAGLEGWGEVGSLASSAVLDDTGIAVLFWRAECVCRQERCYLSHGQKAAAATH